MTMNVRNSSIVSFILVCLVSVACTPPMRSPGPADLFWPLPPDAPKIHYVQSIYSEDDIGRVYSFKEKLFGKEYVDTMSRPYGVSVSGNRIVVTDIVKKAVLIFDLNQKRLLSVGAEGALRFPTAVVSDATGALYVADNSTSKIVVYEPSGLYRTAFSVPNCKPVALAINNALGILYVLDRMGHRVIALDLQGNQLFTFGSPGDANGQFNMPLGITVGGDNGVYVLDSGNFRVQIFDSRGAFISKFGAVGDRPGFFANPKGIAVDSHGHIYVTDAAFCNFQIFNKEGHLLIDVGSLGPAPGQLHLPGGIAIDEQDRIYIADQFNKRIEVFQYLKDTP